MFHAGADIIDIGGESTRPDCYGNAQHVTTEDEINRVIPLVKGLKSIEQDIIISVDTKKADVAQEAINAGADIINDVSGLFPRDNDDPSFKKKEEAGRLATIVAESNAGLILMHMQGIPKTMQHNPEYNNVVTQTLDFLIKAAELAITKGVARDRIMIDPGLGFGKTLKQNLQILLNIDKYKNSGYPVLIGHSRKSFIGEILNISTPKERIWGTAGATAWLAHTGADVARVHDVKEMVETIKVFEAIKYAGIE